MTVGELQKVYFDSVILYRDVRKEEESFEEIYKGKAENIPHDFLAFEIRHFGAKRKDVLDVCVK